MKAVLMSIQPKWCELIASGKKRGEVRKTKPKLETPFKVYIYCTKPNTGSTEDRFYIYLPPHDTPKQVNGTVIGEFVCNRIDTVARIRTPCMDYTTVNDKWETHFCEISCLNGDELGKYLGFNKDGYAWHISNLVIYDNPRGLRSFFKPRTAEELEADVAVSILTCGIHESPFTIKKPPQSWCYVEEVAE